MGNRRTSEVDAYAEPDRVACNGEQHTDVDSSRAVDDGQRRQGVGQGDRRQPVLRAGRLLRMVRSKVGVDVGELVGIEPVGVAATNDVDALLALATRLRRLQPDVAVGRRARPHPRGRASTSSRPPRSSTGARLGRRARPTGRRVRARWHLAVRHGRQPGLRRAGRHHHRRHLQSRRQGHGQRDGRHHLLRLARHRATRRLRTSDRPSRAARHGP